VPLIKRPLSAAILNFKMAAMRPTPKRFCAITLVLFQIQNIIQVAIPRFLGPANQMVPSAMTSHGRHIGFLEVA
jgi:hypothetical protein